MQLRHGPLLLQELLCVTGSVEAASPRVPADQKSIFRDALTSAQLHNLEHEVLTGAETNHRFPGYSLPDDHQARLLHCISSSALHKLFCRASIHQSGQHSQSK